MNLRLPLGVACLAACIPFPLAAAQTLSSIDFTAQEGTTWNDSTVRINFGAGVGMGSITFSSLNSGSFSYTAAGAYNAAPYSSYNGPTSLTTGDVFSPTEEVVFRVLPGPGPGPGGFRMTIALDSGLFPEGSVFSLRSIGLNNAGRYQELTLVSGLSPADPVQLPTDDLWGPPPDMNEISPGVYRAASLGSNSKGRAFAISGGSFTVDLTGDYIGGGEAFTLALAPVPEPSALGLGLVAAGGCLLARRRR